MTKQRLFLFTLVVLMTLALMAPQPLAAQQARNNDAGSVSALLPVAKIIHGVGRNAAVADAKKGDRVFWNDLIKTEKGGRARITLNDQSILSLGSQAELRIVNHDARSQQTALALATGRLRAQVASITRPDGRFELRTPTAVAGVIGTDFGSDATIPGVVTFVCISGITTLSNIDPSVPGQVPCPAGSTVDVATGQTPSQPKPASPQQIQQLIEDTEPASMESLAPNNGGPGETINAVATGTNMNKITGVGVNGAGVVALITAAPEKDSVSVKLTVAPDAEPGPRTIIFTQGDGKQTAAVFTVLSTEEVAEKKRRIFPDPRIDGGDEHSFDVGAPAILDATKSKGSQQSAITAFKWDLCDAEYRPQELGVPYDPEKNNACKPIPNFTGTAAEFKFETCDLVPQDYIARLTVTDENHHTAAVDYRVRVLPETYPGPEEVLQGLAQAYEALQPNRFMDYFSDEFSGYTQLSENIRRTFPTLESMNINLRISQSIRRCNEATLRADWQQNFRLRNGSCVVSSTAGLCFQESQLTMRMVRTPGKHWKILELQGDNGTVQGLPPGPNVDGNLPNLQIRNLQVVGSLIGLSTGVITVDVFNEGASTSGTIFNGIVLRDASGNIIGTADIPPIPPGESVTVPINFIVPNIGGSTDLTVSVLPGNISTTLNTTITTSVAIIPAIVDLQLTAIGFSAGAPPFASGQSRGLTLTVHNAGNTAPTPSDTVSCQLVGSRTVPLGTGFIGSVPPGTSASVPFNFIVPANLAGNDTIDCTISQDTFEAATTLADNTNSIPVLVTTNIDLVLNPPFLQAELMNGSQTMNVLVTNQAPDDAPAGWNILLDIDGQRVATTTGPVVPGFGSVQVPLNYVTPTIADPPFQGDVPLLLQINANSVVPETSTANNTFSTNLTLVDFTMSTATGTALTPVIGRSFNLSPAVLIDPVGNPLPMVVDYVGAPAGLVASGVQGQNLTGVVTAAAGSFNPVPTIILSGITVTSAPLNMNVVPEISMSLGSAFSLVSGGPPGTFTVDVTGAFYPVNLALSLPAGVTIDPTSPTPALNASVPGPSPGSVTWILAAGLGTQIGSNLTNIVVTATDAGQAPYVPAGNVIFAPPYTNNGQANYVVTSAVLQAPHTTGVGNDAYELGETLTATVTVANVGNFAPAGNITLQLTCTPACGSAQVVVLAPGIGLSSVGVVSLPINFATGNYVGHFGIASSPSQSTTADDTFSSNFDVFDFTLSNNGPVVGTLNIPVGDTAQFNFTLIDSGPQLSLPVTVSTGGIAVTSPVIGPIIAPGNYVVDVSGPSALPNDNDLVTISSTRSGTTRTITQPVHFYDGSILQVPAGAGDDSGDPINLTIGDFSGVTIGFKLLGNWQGNAIFQGFTPVTGLTPTLLGVATQPNDTFSINVTAQTGAPFVVTPILIKFLIPNTNPQAFITTQLWVLPRAIPDLSISSVAAPGGRNFNTQPLLSGEDSSVDVTVQNLGSAGSTPGLQAKVHLGSLAGPVIGTLAMPSISVGGSTPLNIPINAPDPVSTGASVLVVEIVQDTIAGELITNNNTAGLNIGTSDWSLQLAGAGSSGTPVSIIVPSPATGATSVLIVPAFGTVVGNLQVRASSAGTNLSVLPVTTNLSSPVYTAPLTINAVTTAQNGLYTVLMQASFPGSSTSKPRGVIVNVSVSGGSSPIAGTITLQSSVNNSASGNNTGCSGSCAPLQINGALVETVTLTPIHSTASSGSVDLVFTDDPQIVSNTDDAGNPLGSPYINGVSFGAATPVNFTPIDSGGIVTPGPAKVVVNMTGIQATIASRGFPITPVIPNAQYSTLYYVIGDIGIVANSNGCINVPPGAGVPLHIDFITFGGFNAPTIDWSWSNPGDLNVSIDRGSGSSLFAGTGYNPEDFIITNTGLGDITGASNIQFTITVSNSNGSASENFLVPLHLNALAGCQQASRGGSFTASAIRGSWSRTTSLTSSMSTAGPRAAKSTSGLPDLQIKASDVSFTPSTPVPGDTVNVRFKVANLGTAAATAVPIALVVNGQVVASNTFDVAAGSSTLGGLDWNTTGFHVPVPRGRSADTKARLRPVSSTARGGRVVAEAPDRPEPEARPVVIDVKLVIDPAGTRAQKTAENKTVALSQLQVRPGAQAELARSGITDPARAGAGEHVWVEVSEVCIGLRMPLAVPTGCEGSDLDLHVEDVGSGKYALSSAFGVADLGAALAAAPPASAQYSSRVPLLAGHTYAIQGASGKTSVFTVSQVLSPQQFAALLKQKFQRAARRLARDLGGDTGGVEAGDVSGFDPSKAIVYFDLALRPPAE